MAKALENVGNAYIKQPDYRRGLVYYKKALKMAQVLYGKAPHIEIANMLKNVGVAYGRDKTNQLTYYKKALSMYKVWYKDQSHVDVANMLSIIGGGVIMTEGISEKHFLTHKNLSQCSI